MSIVKQKMIQIATETAQKAGIRAITMRELGDAVGIKSSSVMYHFRSKDGLLQEISSSYLKLFFQQLDQIEQNIDAPGERLQALVGLFEDSLSADKMCLCGMLAAENADLDDITRTTTRHFFKRTEEWVATQLKAADANPDMAQLIVSSMEGAMLLDRLESKDVRLKAVREWLITLTA